MVHPIEIRTSISPSSAVEFNTTSALANYATEAGGSGIGTSGDKQTMFYVEVTDQMKIGSGGGNPKEGELIEVVEMSISEATRYMAQDEVKSPDAPTASVPPATDSPPFRHSTKSPGEGIKIMCGPCRPCVPVTSLGNFLSGRTCRDRRLRHSSHFCVLEHCVSLLNTSWM
uniref:(California timema) hypothetical protein n=1 Tax=Timema californicum TaxID=61474 RepID=A0A7R9P8W2_TIMCA|nr:unnamed protein product [Timema californicum]